MSAAKQVRSLWVTSSTIGLRFEADWVDWALSIFGVDDWLLWWACHDRGPDDERNADEIRRDAVEIDSQLAHPQLSCVGAGAFREFQGRQFGLERYFSVGELEGSIAQQVAAVFERQTNFARMGLVSGRPRGDLDTAATILFTLWHLNHTRHHVGASFRRQLCESAVGLLDPDRWLLLPMVDADMNLGFVGFAHAQLVDQAVARLKSVTGQNPSALPAERSWHSSLLT